MRATLASRTDIGKLSLVLSRMEDDERELVLSDMDATDAADVRAILEFPQDTAGRLMDTRVLTFKKSQTVAETIGQLRKRRRRKGVSELRIVDEAEKLIGLVDIRDLALADGAQTLGLVIVIAVSMVISMVMAGIAGALVPIMLSKLGQDPAVASSIVLTTITDIAGFFSFPGIATLLMGMLAPV